MNPDIYFELVKQISTLQRQVDGLIKPEVSVDLISPFLSLSGLVGFWPMSSVQRSTGNVYDLSGQGRTLTYNGNPTFNYTGLVPYIDLDGTGDYLSRADETDLDILGTESIYAAGTKGLTMGGWFWCNSGSSDAGLISKGFNTAYAVTHHNGATIYFYINSGAGAVNHSVSQTAGVWYFLVCRFVPSTSMDIYLNGIKSSKTTGVPASIANVASAFQIGNATTVLDGRASLCFLCANSLSDAQVNSLFQQTRGAFGI